MSQASGNDEENYWLLSSSSSFINAFRSNPFYGLLSVACTLLCLRIALSTHWGLPPGPWGFPILGVLPLMGKRPHLTVQRWWDRYGDVVCVYMGRRLVIILNGTDAMKECFVRQSDVFAGRPWNYLKKLTKGKGLVFSEGETWREHRRFALSCLRDFGMGKVVIEEKVLEEAAYLKEVIVSFEGKPFDPAEWVTKAVSNMISSIIYGSRFDYSDPVFLANLSALSQSTRNQSLVSLVNFLPILEFLPKVLPKDKMLMRNVRMRQEYARAQLASHRESFDRENPRDFIDAYLARMEEMKERGEETTFDADTTEDAVHIETATASHMAMPAAQWAIIDEENDCMECDQEVPASQNDANTEVACASAARGVCVVCDEAREVVTSSTDVLWSSAWTCVNHDPDGVLLRSLYFPEHAWSFLQNPLTSVEIQAILAEDIASLDDLSLNMPPPPPNSPQGCASEDDYMGDDECSDGSLYVNVGDDDHIFDASP